MGAIIPAKVAESSLSHRLIEAGLTRIFQGKVRDTYQLPDFPHLLLVVATDRVSIFDFVLPALVKDKGERLTAMTVFWLTGIFKAIRHHLIAYGSYIDRYLPSSLRGITELRKRALVVKKVKILPIECIVRGYLTGSAWSAYQENGKVCGISLPEGLHDGSQLPEPIFTPSTKAEAGHDEHLNEKEVIKEYSGQIKSIPLFLYETAVAFASKKGVIIADTKFEFGAGVDIILADEVLTPDSSRFWLEEYWAESVKKRKSPPSHDKQVVREWGKTVDTPFGMTGINNLNTENTEHIDFVHQQVPPEEMLNKTTDRYHEIFSLLIGCELGDFQTGSVMNIR